ncbi:MAG: ParB/RepB/Spo0J family partition protein [Myxococcota bacterium]
MTNVRQVRLTELRESPTNPRHLFGDLTELADSIKAQGVLQPLLARRVGEHLELVFGHRRFRAAKLAGLREVPVVVREMTDVEVLEAQIAENLAREDVHPLELAEGYRRLMEKGFNADQVADRLGVSRSSVYTTLKLLDLADEAKKDFLAGRITTHAAVAIARLKGERLQVSATKAVVAASKDGPLPVRAVQKLVQRRFTPKKATERAEPKPAAPTVDEREVAERATQLLLARVVETTRRKPALDDADARLLLLALGDLRNETMDLLVERGATERKLPQLRGAELRSLLLEAVLSLWVTPGSDAEKAVARIYGVSLAELRKTAHALVEADALMGSRNHS